MFVIPGSTRDIGRQLTRAVAAQVARNWSVLLLNGVLLVVAGVLIFSIDWTVGELAALIAALFIFQGLVQALTTAIDARARRANVIAGLLSIAAGIVIIAWPGPGVLAVAIFLGAWLIASGTFGITAALAARDLLPVWWLVLLVGALEIVLGVLALVAPGATLAAIITVAGIWAVVIGAMRIAIAFELKRLPNDVDDALTSAANRTVNHNGVARRHVPVAQP